LIINIVPSIIAAKREGTPRFSVYVHNGVDLGPLPYRRAEPLMHCSCHDAFLPWRTIVINGTFDDRDDARMTVKQWLTRHEMDDYTVANMRELVRVMTLQGEPVDDIRVEYRERSYGMLRGIVEFAGEQASVVSGGAGSLLKQAAEMLPHAATAACEKVCHALELLEGDMNAVGNASMERARMATRLAASLLMMSSNQTVRAAA
jgi:hypothetical protein